MVEYTNNFKRKFKKIKDNNLKLKIIKQISKLKENPEMGKPMRYERRNSRELYLPPFRLSYFYNKEENKIIILDLYHKDMQ